jgi:Carboxypeptidase regulatory-like domain
MQATPKASAAARSVALLSTLAIAVVTAYSSPARSQEGGAIKGAVVYTGAVPTKKVIPKDPEICGEPHSEPQIVVDANKGVKDAIVYLEGVAKGSPMSKPAKPAVIDNKNCSFVPESQIVAPGPIEIVNSDPVLHNTHGFYGKRTAFNVALPNQGQRVSKDLPRSGLVRVECDEHGHMHATVYVADHPYHAVTAADGAFTIKDVPPGNYKLVVYQRHTGPIETAVAVKPKETTDVKVDLKQ